VLAGLTPPGHEVSIVEEEFESPPTAEHWDLVGMTTMTANSQRAYRLARRFQECGAKVVLGGVHPSVLPDEASRHADAIVIGEAEGVWPRIVSDVRHNRLQRAYHNEQPDLSTSPFPVRKTPRRIFGLPPYVMPIMSTRGCAYNCEFCSVHRLYGHKARHVPIPHIVADIARNEPKLIIFLDDNIGADRAYSLALFEAVRPLRKSWCGQATLRFILDEDLFAAAVASGLKAVFVGVETIEPEAHAGLRKALGSMREYDESVRRCRAAGVMFHASLIFGLDGQTPRVFERTLDFLARNSVPSISANMLTPYPGTQLFDRLKRENRILHTNWAYYDHQTVCFQPKNMSVEELSERHLAFCREFLSWSSIARRLPAQLGNMPLLYLGMNLAMRRGVNRLKHRQKDYMTWLRQPRQPDGRNQHAPEPPDIPADAGSLPLDTQPAEPAQSIKSPQNAREQKECGTTT
jgi:radical SAM superfamily enzyme YgiQ (UPF0313 family)